MIRILYSDLEIDIRADRTGFAEIRTGIEEVVSGRVATWRVSTQSTDPLPYDVCLAGLAVELGDGLNVFCRLENELVIRGGLKSLANLSLNKINSSFKIEP